MGTTELPSAVPMDAESERHLPCWPSCVGGAMMFSWSNVFHTASTPILIQRRPDEPADQRKDALFAAARQQMVEEQLRRRDIADPRVLEVMGRVARERFVPARRESTLTRTIRCPSDSARRFRSRTSWR